MPTTITNTTKAIKGMSSQTLVTISLGILEIISFSIMSRLLSQQDFGYYAAITAVTTIFASFSETGIGSAIIQKKDISTHFINNAFTLSLILGLVISSLLLILSKPLSGAIADSTMAIPLMLMSVTLLLHCMTSVNVSLMQRKLQFLRVGVINLISLVVTTIVAVLLAYNGYGYYAIIAKAILTSIITWLLSLILCRTRFKIEFEKKTIKEIFSFSGWLMASVVFRNLAHQVDKLLMPRLLSVSALGSYNRPKDFVEQITNKLNGIFDTALFPVLSGIQDNSNALRSAYQRSLSILNTFALLLTLAFIFNSGLIVRVFLGKQWLYLEPIFMIISCSVLFDIDGRLADCFMRSLALTRQQFYFRIFEAIIKIAGIFIGYRWGIMGVAISFVITNLIVKTAKICFVGWKIEINTTQVFKIIITSWRFSVILIPVLLLISFILPHSLWGDCTKLFFFFTVTVLLFFLMPNFIGSQYKKDVFLRVKNTVNIVIKHKL